MNKITSIEVWSEQNTTRYGSTTKVEFIRGKTYKIYSLDTWSRASRFDRKVLPLVDVGSTTIRERGRIVVRYVPKPAPTPAPMPTVTYTIMAARSFPMPDNKSVLIVAVRGMGDNSWAAYMGLVDQSSDYSQNMLNRQLIAESGLKLYEWEARGIFQYERFADIPYRR